MWHFRLISKLLTDLLKKGVMFVWTDVHKSSFLALKNALTSAVVLALPDFTKPFVVETDANELGIDVVLMQSGHQLVFF